ncbi:MAG: ATP-binding protein [Acidobacteriia bacterium]|nr:ATP-binding protein [Terriglobia bacterium]
MSEIDLTFDGDLQEVERLATEVEWYCQENGLDSEVEFDLNLALEELFVNALRHGGCQGIKDAVRVRLVRQKDGVRAEFSDCGPEFDPATAPQPDLEGPLAGRPIGGLGLHLVRHTMSGLEYRRADGRNYVTMWRPI